MNDENLPARPAEPAPGGLRRLLDRAEIHDVILRYCRGIDRMDLDLVRSCFHPDATDEHGSFSGTAEEFVTWVARLLPRYDTTMHLVANHLVEFTEDLPGHARAETYGVAFHRSADPDPRKNLVTGFRYVDDFSRRDGGPWLIARRVCTTEWVRADTPDVVWPIPDGMRRGTRGPGDAVYAPPVR